MDDCVPMRIDVLSSACSGGCSQARAGACASSSPTSKPSDASDPSGLRASESPAPSPGIETTGDWAVTGRRKMGAMPVEIYLLENFPGMRVSSIFGFCGWNPMYGGRQWSEANFSPADLAWMYDHGIAYRIPISSSLITREVYLESKPFLAEHHRAGNSVILSRRDVAEWIAEDFPLYERELSVTSKTKNVEDLASQFDLFGTVVPHPKMNDDLDALSKIGDKSRIRLFTDIFCLYSCKTMHCYAAVSKYNREPPFKGKPNGWQCARFSPKDSPWKQENPEWDVRTVWSPDELAARGFTKFKTLGEPPGAPRGVHRFGTEEAKAAARASVSGLAYPTPPGAPAFKRESGS